MATSISPLSAWGVLPTPFTPDLCGVDEESLSSLARNQRLQGVERFIALGVLGEPEELTVNEMAGSSRLLAAAEGHPSSQL
jgi:dihydrodipicolinate synthase/N-acetylneuraminate lyase